MWRHFVFSERHTGFHIHYKMFIVYFIKYEYNIQDNVSLDIYT